MKMNLEKVELKTGTHENKETKSKKKREREKIYTV